MSTEKIEMKIFNGLDVSEYQGKIDWQKVRREGKEAVYIRSSLGNTYVDKEFENNYIGAKTAGLKVGFYHYVTAKNTSQARTQARFFVETIKNKSFDMRLAMDFEYFGELSKKEINEIGEAFLDELTDYSGKPAVVYGDASSAENIWSISIAEKYPLWVAEWNVRTPEFGEKWKKWAGWQYTDKGKLDGIVSEGTDLDRFTDDIFVDDTKSVYREQKSSDEAKHELINYIVKEGDTLLSIAEMLNAVPSEIAGLNNIKSPFLLETGRLLKILHLIK